MHRRVLIGEYQKVTSDDFNNFGRFPREAMDILVRDAVDNQKAFAGFPVIVSAPAVVTVGDGRFYSNGEMFVHNPTGGSAVDLLDNLPAVAQRIATIVVWGTQVDTALEPRTFLVDPVTRQTEGRDVATESRRVAQVGAVYGVENATPTAPTVDANMIAVADVRLSPAGIEEIIPRTAGRLRSSRSNYAEIQELQSWRQQNGAAVQTLKTDVAGLADTMRTKASRNFVAGLAADLGLVKDRVGLPEDYTAYGGDNYFNEDKSDTGAAGYNATIDKGLLAGVVGEDTSHIALFNSIDANVEVHNDLAFARFEDFVRKAWIGRNSEHALTSTTIETVTLVKKTITKSRTVHSGGSYGTRPPVAGERPDPNHPLGWVDAGWFPGGTRTEYYEETYWDEETTSEPIVGANTARTFLNGQEGYFSGVDLYFTRRDIAGDVRVVLCETSNSGQPRHNAVLAETTLAQSDLKVWPEKTPVDFVPTHLVKGRRYAIIAVTSGAHFLAMVDGAEAQGATFYMQEGAWVQEPANRGPAMALRYAEFTRSRVEVSLQPVELSGGFNRIEIESQSIVPEGTRIEYMLRVNGVWRGLTEGDANILSSQPNIAQMKAVLIGTTDLMPALGLGATRTNVRVARHDTEFTHISTAFEMPAAVDEVTVIQSIYKWEAGDHTHSVSILSGASYATEDAPDAVSDEVSPEDPDIIIRTATFTLSAPATSFKIKTEGETSNPASNFVVLNTKYVAFSS